MNPAEVHGVLPIPLVQRIGNRADPVPLFVALEQGKRGKQERSKTRTQEAKPRKMPKPLVRTSAKPLCARATLDQDVGHVCTASFASFACLSLMSFTPHVAYCATAAVRTNADSFRCFFLSLNALLPISAFFLASTGPYYRYAWPLPRRFPRPFLPMPHPGLRAECAQGLRIFIVIGNVFRFRHIFAFCSNALSR